MEKKPTISVVLSFFNEESVLSELVHRLRTALRAQLKAVISGYELIFVNDASIDRSKEILMDLSGNIHDIKILNMSRNFGVSECVMAGLKFSSGDAVIYMDADLQDPPEIIPEMIKEWLSTGADVVHTKRKTREGESKIKLWLTKLGYIILNKTSNITIELEVGDFKLLSRRVVNELLKLNEKKPFMRGLVNWVGFKQETIYYHREKRFAGETNAPILGWRVISNFLDSALISFSDIPLKISLIIGFLVSVGAFFYIIVVIIQKIMGWYVPGWPAIMATMLILGGVQLMTLGILGLYINNIYLESKKRPNYIVENTFGFDNDV